MLIALAILIGLAVVAIAIPLYALASLIAAVLVAATVR